MKHKIAVHKGCKDKGDPQNVATGWSNIREDLSWLLGWVKAGYPWCATHFADKHRLADNACGSTMVVIDFDGDTTLHDFWQTTTAKQWCAATYTSSSHSAEEHRFRAIFPLALELESSGVHRAVYWLIAGRLVDELNLSELKDNCGQKPERLWYGNSKAIVQENPGAVVPDFMLSDIEYNEPSSDFKQTETTQKDIDRCRYLLENLLRPSVDGEYESRYVPVMAACAGIGEPVFDSWVDWVLKGHHGHKEENIQPFKWRGLGTYSGPAKLYSLAKEQDINWTNQLPHNLRFGAEGGAVGYKEFDPEPCLDQVKGDEMDIDNDPLPDVSTVKTKAGRPKKSASDLAKERESDVGQVKEILSGLRKNTLTQQIEYDDRTGRALVIEGDDLNLMTTKLAIENGIFIPEARMKAAIQYAANCNSYCPIRQYLDHCSRDVTPFKEWDSIGEIFLGNKHKIATQALQRMMIGAVARGYNPGCSMSWLPILVGAQGVGKSMFARNLVPPSLFAEITSPLETLHKEPYRLHTSGWLLELPEIDNFFSVRNIENFKNIITTRVDEVRMPYENPKKMARKFVLLGTTNRNQFLLDSTGNRRFVPLEITLGFQIPWQRLAEQRDAIWAAAIAAFREGVGYEFNSGEIAAIAEYIQEFGEPDPWADKIVAYASVRQEVQVAKVLTEALELDPRNQGRREARRVADVLQSMGWRRLITSRKDERTGRFKSVRIWQRPKNDPLAEDHILNDF